MSLTTRAGRAIHGDDRLHARLLQDHIYGAVRARRANLRFLSGRFARLGRAMDSSDVL